MDGIYIENTDFPNGQEYLWDCKNIKMKNVKIENCDYAFMHSENINLENYRHEGNYGFQQARNITIHNAVINSKDSFWEAENVVIYDSVINSEYLGWYSKNIKFVGCHLSGEQILCYIDGLILEDCTFGEESNLMFEYSVVNGNIKGNVDSIKNPTSGRLIVEGRVKEIIWDKNQKAPANAEVIVKGK